MLFIEALRDERLLLTRNSKLTHKPGIRMLRIKSDKLSDQVTQLIKELDLRPQEDLMFSRCIVCNSQLKEIDKDKVKARVPQYVFNTQQDFLSCPVCGRIYWKGTHWGNVQSILNRIKA